MIKNLERDVSFFLSCGFLPHINEGILQDLFKKVDFASIQNNSNALYEKDERSLVDACDNALTSSFANIGEGYHIVPLSGGLDSRAILGYLVNAGLKDKIITVTYGIPGTYDYEISKLLAKKIGLAHTCLDLNRVKISSDSLLEAAVNGSSWTLLFDAMYNSLLVKEFGKDCTYWSGFIGGETAGSHLPANESKDWNTAKKHFLTYNRLTHSSAFLYPDYNILDSFPEEPIFDSALMNYDDQLDFSLRQANYIKRVVVLDDYKYRTPFLEEKWVGFMLSIPRKHRLNKKLFVSLLKTKFPELFKLPVTNNYGGSLFVASREYQLRKFLNRLNNKVSSFPLLKTNPLSALLKSFRIFYSNNYIDFGRAIQKRKDFQEVINENLSDLQRRKLIYWFDFSRLMDEHINKKADHTFLLMLLTALEISIKSESSKI